MELLSPAGHWEAMVAAVQCGADAVYLGCGDLNARRGAKNFSLQELPRAVSYCHTRGVKVYLTVNTLVTDREMDAAREQLLLASRCGVDAVIVQDWGLASLARSAAPDLPLHGSTQMTIHSLAGVEAAAELGLRCAVLSRELSREDIRSICQKSPIAIEVFAHGALCMCWSGQCAMSALIGERSGNRGLCAQPCRLPYRLDGGKTGHPLSLKDMNLASHLGELEKMGVSVLKLEGRMKRPEYVAVITRIYAALLKEKRLPTAEELEQLERAFSRSGFTGGYWQGDTGPHMFGTRSESAPDPAALFKEARAAYEKEDRRTVPVSLSAEISANRPARLTADDGAGRTYTAQGPVPEPARTKPLTEADLSARLAKTGGTAFRAETVEVRLDGGLSLPVSAVNGLRREALDGLASLRGAPPERREGPVPPLPESPCAWPDAPALTVSLTRAEQLTDAVAAGAEIVYLPAERLGDFDALPPGPEYCVSLPRVCKDREETALLALLERGKELGCVSLAVQNIGQVRLSERLGLRARGDFGLNVFNSRSLEQLKCWGLESAVVSFELRHEQVRDLRKCLPCEAIVYGRLPLMITENCLISNGLGGCRTKDLRGLCRKPHALTDRRGEAFPILPVFGCRSEIENSKVFYLADKPEFRRCGLRYARLRFTGEPPEACEAVLAQFRAGEGEPPENFTRGLFYRGVE